MTAQDGFKEEHPVAVVLKLREPTAIFLAARRTAFYAFSRRVLIAVICRWPLQGQETDTG